MFSGFKNIRFKILFLLIGILLFTGCEKDELIYLDDTKTIVISKNIKINNGIIVRDHTFNRITYNNFLKYLCTSERFLLVQQKDFEKTFSRDKVIISLRHDVDYNIDAAVKFAYLEKKYGVKSTYYILHTSDYYGVTSLNYFRRSNNVIHYIKKIQDAYGHEIGWHNDLVTLQVVYNIEPREFLSTELDWLRFNNIDISGSSSHGSEYCYDYHYVNTYFWSEYETGSAFFYNFKKVLKNGELINIVKDSYHNYDLEYECGFLKPDYFFADVPDKEGVRWHMGMVDFDTIQPGKKVIILLHPEHWD